MACQPPHRAAPTDCVRGPREAEWAARRGPQEPNGSRVWAPAAAALALGSGPVQAPRGPSCAIWNNQAGTNDG